MLTVQQLSCGHGQRTVLKDLSFQLHSGDLMCLLGPNGVGKTTLFKTLLGLLPAHAGQVVLNGKPKQYWSRKRFAQWVGYVPQAHTPPFAFPVRDVVAMGRVAHLGLFSTPKAVDWAVAEQALESLGIQHLRSVPYTEISGGERQLVLIARALAQQPKILVMDEPTSNLDYGNQLRVLAHVREIAKAHNIGVLLTTHYPNHALLYATRVLALERNGQYRLGYPESVVTEDYLKDTYQVEVEIHHFTQHSGDTFRLCVPKSA